MSGPENNPSSNLSSDKLEKHKHRHFKVLPSCSNAFSYLKINTTHSFITREHSICPIGAYNSHMLGRTLNTTHNI